MIEAAPAAPAVRPSLLGRIVRGLGLVEMPVAVAAFAVGVSISAVQIGLRTVSGASIWWGQEVTLLLMLVAYFVGASCVFRARGDVVIDFAVKLTPPRVQNGLYVIAQLVVLAFFGLVAAQLMMMAEDAARTFTPIMRLPKLWFYLPLLYASLSVCLTTLHALDEARRAGIGRAGGIDDLERRATVPLGRFGPH